MAESFSTHLQYPSMKARAVASRTYKTKLAPTNGSSFVCNNGNAIRFELPGNQSSRFYDFQACYIKCTLTNTAAAQLDRPGVLSLIKRIQVTTGGTVISDLDSFNVLACALLDQDASPMYLSSTGSILMGTRGDSLAGEPLDYTPAVADPAAAAIPGVRTFCFPLFLTALSLTSPNRFIPAFSRAPIQIDIYLESSASAVVSAGAPVLTLSDVSMHMSMVELSPAAMQELNSRCGGQFNMLCHSWSNYSSMIPQAASAHTCTIGAAVSSLERILVVHRNAAHTTTQNVYSIGNRSKATLQTYVFQLNGESHPSFPVQVGLNSAEALAEALISSHNLTSVKDGTSLMNGLVSTFAGCPSIGFMNSVTPLAHKPRPYNEDAPLGTTPGGFALDAIATSIPASSTIGTFLASVDFEGGLSRGATQSIYSGLSSIGSTLQYVGTYTNVPALTRVDFFCMSTIVLGLNMNGSGTFQIAV